MNPKILASLLGLALALAFFGCTSVTRELSKEEIAAAQFPAKPTDWMARADQYFRTALKDYDSAKFEGWTLYRAYCPNDPPIFGHAVTVRVNAKNSYGGYTGFRPYVFFVRPDGVLVNAENLFALHMMHLVDVIDP